MRLLIRAGILTVTFGLGVFVVGLIRSVVFHGFTEAAVMPIEAPTVTPSGTQGPEFQETGIRVAYAGVESDQESGDQRLSFLIHNGTFQPISYAAHFSDSIFPVITRNGGEPQPFYGCGTGISTFYILPGTSAIVRLNKIYFDEVRKGDVVAVGFGLKPALGERRIYTSAPFEIPEEFVSSAD